MKELLRADAIIPLRDQLREAREYAIKDAEGYEHLLFAFERLGSVIKKEIGTLKDYESGILELAKKSTLAKHIPKKWREWHTPVSYLYDAVRAARNDALHQGAFARHLTTHAIQLEIILEDALMSGMTTVGDFMVRNPVCAEMWQPLSFIRQQMLANSFSYLPVRATDGKWHLVSDQELARYLRVNADQRRGRLAKPLSEALEDSTNRITLTPATPVSPVAPINEIAQSIKHKPVLVTRDGLHSDLIGIITAFDLL